MSRRLVWHTEDIKDVILLLLSCKKETEIENVFDKILTPREINDIGRRFKVLRMVDEGKTFTEIVKETGMSSVTVSRITSKCGFGFRKGSGIAKDNHKEIKTRKRAKLKYKGVKVR